MVPSSQQFNVIDHMHTSNENVVVEALAGTGKTALIKMVFDAGSVLDSNLYLVFNKRNQEEAMGKMPRNVQVSTLNAYGNAMCRDAYHSFRIDADKTKFIYLYKVKQIKTLEQSAVSKAYKMCRKVCRIVSLLKGHLILLADAEAMIPDLVDKFDIEVKESEMPEFVADCVETLRISNQTRSQLDFDDQLYFPAIDQLIPKVKFDLAFIDECQDLNQAKIDLVAKLMEQKTRIGIVGDRHQAIYGFAGTDTESMDRLIKLVGGKVYPLSVNYRCSKAVIAQVQKTVPEIMACDTAVDGRVDSVKKEGFKPGTGDYVICRTVAPLVSNCLGLIRKGQKAVVLGREIGQGLKDTVAGLEGSDIKSATQSLEEWYSKESARKEAAGRDTTEIQDRYETIICLFEQCDSLGEVTTKIDSIFSDTGSAITFMSGHKSKGLEADNVWVLRPDLLPHPKATQPWQVIQEKNLKYVVESRAKVNLTYVEDK